jgi:hypothetical protein
MGLPLSANRNGIRRGAILVQPAYRNPLLCLELFEVTGKKFIFNIAFTILLF